MLELAPIPKSEIVSSEICLLENANFRSPIDSLKCCNPISSLGREMIINTPSPAEKNPPNKRLSLHPSIEPRIAQPAKPITLPKLYDRLFQPSAAPSDPLLK